MNIEEIHAWLEPDGPVAITVLERLQPVMGRHSVFFPPTFAPPEDKKDDPPSYVIDETTAGPVALVDSVGSQANRMEPIFKQEPYSKLVPRASIKVGSREIDLLDAGHRAADAVVRFSDQWERIKSCFTSIRDEGNATPLAKLAPTSILFGVWDSRDTQVKLPRLIGSTIRAYNVDKLTRAAQFFAATEKEEIEDLGDQKSLSKMGLNDSPSGRTLGGVICRDTIVREAILHLIALRTLKGKRNEEEETRKLRRYLLGLALVALFTPYPKFLREGCLLVRDENAPPEVKKVDRRGTRENVDVTETEALNFAQAAADEFKVGENWSAVFGRDLVKKNAEAIANKALATSRHKEEGSEVSADELCISVTLLTGRYHGEEWPPSPAKLFRALVAATHGGCAAPDSDTEKLLIWLENQSAPRIRVCESRAARSYRIAVPNNDLDVPAREWAAGRHSDPAKIRTLKDVDPREMARQGPHVQYIWGVTPGADQQTESFQRLVHKLHTFGWGVDMAYADCSPEDPELKAFEPASSGPRLAVPMTGTLDDLRTTNKRFAARASGAGVDTNTRPTLSRLQAYRECNAYAPSWESFVLLQPDSDLTRSVPWSDCMKVAGWLRHASANALRGELPEEVINSYALGHSEEPRANRLSYVPLPSLHTRHGDGLFRRALIVEPTNAVGDVTSLLAFKLAGAMLTGPNGITECVLAPSGEEDWVLKQYTRRGLVWRSVTPVVLHGHNLDRHGVISLRKTERLLLRAFEMAGIAPDQIASLAFQAGPLWPGTRHASAMRVPDHLRDYPKVHVEVKLRKEVRGPVLAGIGRHYGIGLFASV